MDEMREAQHPKAPRAHMAFGRKSGREQYGVCAEFFRSQDCRQGVGGHGD